MNMIENNKIHLDDCDLLFEVGKCSVKLETTMNPDHSSTLIQ